MTCIVAVSKAGTVWLGGDRAATNSNFERTIINDPKVFMSGEMGIGVCGSPKVLDAVAHVIKFPKQRTGHPRAFLAGEWVPALRAGLKELDCTVNTQEHGTCFEGEMLLAYRGQIYKLETNFQLIVNKHHHDSVGSGATIALGSLMETWRIDNPRKRVMAALKAASEANASVAPPFDVIVIGKERSEYR